MGLVTSNLPEETFFLKRVVYNAPQYVFWKDVNSVYLGCNKNYAELIGISEPHEIIGKTDLNIGWLSDGDTADLFIRGDKETMEGKKFINNEEWLSLSSGKKILVLVNKSPILNESNEVIGVLGIATDITEKKEKEDEVKKANAKKTRLLSAIECLMREPLNAILGSTQVLKRTSLYAKQKQLTNLIHSAAKKIIPMIDRVRYFQDVENDVLRDIDIHFKLKEFLDECIISHKNNAEEKNLIFNYIYDENLPDWVSGEKSFIGQVLNNILSNAVRFTTQGTIEVTVEKINTLSDVDFLLLLMVKDTGRGIRSSACSNIFNLFDDKIEKEKSESFIEPGLNLSISYKMIEKLHGSISVESKLNKGSTFCITVPLKIDTEKKYYKNTHHNINKNRHDNGQLKPTEEQKNIDRLIHILILEDEPVSQRVLKFMLESEYNCRIDQCYSLSEASNFINNDYDIVFLDMNLSDGTGIDFLKQLKDMKGEQHAPVVTVTAYVSQEESTNIFNAGAFDIIPKPLDLNTLNYVVDTYVFGD